MNRPVVGYNRLCVDARPSTMPPPNGFVRRKIRANFARRFGLLPEISRSTVPEKRAKLTLTSGLFRRQSAKNSKLTVPDLLIETGVAARRSRNQNRHHHGVTERNDVFLSGSHETRKKNSEYLLSFIPGFLVSL